MVTLNNKFIKHKRKAVSMFLLVILTILFFLPSLQANTSLQNYDTSNAHSTNKNPYLTGCKFIIYGRINKSWIEHQGTSIWLWIHAEAVHVIGSGWSYDGAYSVTQWIYSEDVKLSWQVSHGPEFRGIVTDDLIIGMQKSRRF